MSHERKNYLGELQMGVKGQAEEAVEVLCSATDS